MNRRPLSGRADTHRLDRSSRNNNLRRSVSVRPSEFPSEISPHAGEYSGLDSRLSIDDLPISSVRRIFERNEPDPNVVGGELVGMRLCSRISGFLHALWSLLRASEGKYRSENSIRVDLSDTEVERIRSLLLNMPMGLGHGFSTPLENSGVAVKREHEDGHSGLLCQASGEGSNVPT